MDNHCCICGAYLADTGRMVCPRCDIGAKPILSAENAIEILKNPKKYMYIQEGEIELEGWLKESIKKAINALKKEA